jgi:hypothetical protein
MTLALVASVAVMPSFAQTSKTKAGEATATGASVDDTSKVRSADVAKTGGSASNTSIASGTGVSTTRTTTTTRTTHTTRGPRHIAANKVSKARVSNDINRLQSVLIGFSSTANLSDEAVKRSANEAFMLANRINGRIRLAVKAANRADAVAAARDLRMHVKEMRAAAMSGDKAGAASHAGMALPFTYKLEDLM